MTLKKSLKNPIRGWLPKDSAFPLADNQKIRLTPINRTFDKKLVAGTVTITVIILIFGVYTYNTFSQPIIHGPRGWYTTSFVVDDSLNPYINITSYGGIRSGGIDDGWILLNGTVNWIGAPHDPVKSLENIHLVIYTRVDNRTYMNGTLIFLTIGSHVETSPNEPTIPNDTICHVEVIIPVLGLDTPEYQYSFNCSTAINDLGDA